jgi:hypothetical protein
VRFFEDRLQLNRSVDMTWAGVKTGGPRSW